MGRSIVAPLARALDLLAAFSPHDRWLATSELAARTGLPASTVTRLARTLVTLGYLHLGQETRRYRLSAAVLALGYAAIANSRVQRHAGVLMRDFAREHRVHVNLAARERLDVIVVDSCAADPSTAACELHVGTRVGIASSPLGWALLAALPELERYYLMENIERRLPREWARLRRKLGEAIAQVNELGYCTSPAEWSMETGAIAAPLVVDGHSPVVVSCTGPSLRFTRTRIARELAPKLLAMVTAIQAFGAAV